VLLEQHKGLVGIGEFLAQRQGHVGGFGGLYVLVSEPMTLSIGHIHCSSKKDFPNTGSEDCLLEAEACSSLAEDRLFSFERMPRELGMWSCCPSPLLDTSAVQPWWDLVIVSYGAQDHCRDPHRLGHSGLKPSARAVDRLKLCLSDG